MTLLMIALSLALAGTGPARVIARRAEPLAATGSAGGGFTLLADNGRFSWAPGGVSALRTPLPVTFSADLSTASGSVNARGDTLLVDARAQQIQVLALDASGASAAASFRTLPADYVGRIAADVGPDGTAIVAWTVDKPFPVLHRDVFATLRPPGGSFGPVRVIAAAGANDLVGAVRTDGIAELAYFADGGVFHIELPGGEPVRVVATGPEVTELGLVAGGPGVSRVMVSGSDALMTVLRLPDGTWSAPQRLSRSFVLGTPLAGLADGGAILVYDEAGTVVVRRAPPRAGFGPEQVLARRRGNWTPYTFTAATGPRGDALVVWIEGSEEEHLRLYDLCEDPCHERVMAATALPNGRFGAPEMVSPLGTITNGFSDLAIAVSATGERLIAWQSGAFGRQPAGALVATRRSGVPAVVGTTDVRKPRITATVSRAGLRRGRVRGRFGCSEPCALRANLISVTDYYGYRFLHGLPPVVRSRAGASRVDWRLSAKQRRKLRRILRIGHVWLSVSAVDAAGNRAVLNRRLE